jgi:hypothetical protein
MKADFDAIAALGKQERMYDRALLSAVLSWAREQGWQHTSIPRCVRSPNDLVEVWWTKTGLLGVHIQQKRGGEMRSITVPTTSVHEAIDILTALRVLPMHFSSLYAAGRASAQIAQWGQVTKWF